jgi:hypothetical protein
MEVPLLADCVCLAHPRNERGVDVPGVLEAKRVQVIPRRERLDLPKTSVLQAACENHVAIEPSFSRRDLREGHADLEGDPCLLGENDHRADRAHRIGDEVEQLAHDRVAPSEVMIEVV